MWAQYRRTALLLIVLLTTACAIYSRFVFGNGILLYKDIGSDSLISYYPDFVHLSNYIRREGYPGWSFYIGMGQDLAYATGFLLWQPVCWLPHQFIAHALIFEHLAKVLLAGYLFARFLELRGLATPAQLLGALLLAFSGYMCVASTSYYPLADEVVCFSAALLGTELLLQEGRWLLLALAVATAGMINPFHIYLLGPLVFAYAVTTLTDRSWECRKIAFAVASIAVVASLGAALGAVITLPYLKVVLGSPRGSGATSLVPKLLSFPVFGFESLQHYFAATLRVYSTDMLGTGDAYRGWQNYLEAPLSYAGPLPLLLLPQAFSHRSRRSRTILLILIVLLAVPSVFPWFRYLFWMFQGDYYRTYSLFWVLAVLTLSVTTFSRYCRGQRLSLTTLSCTIAALLALLYFLPTEVNRPIQTAVACYLVLYGLLLCAGQVFRFQRVAALSAIVLTGIELIHFGFITTTQRDFLTKEELQTRTGYNDETIEAIADLKASDSSFFRISKPRPSAPTRWYSYNDAMIFGYYSTSSYSSFNNANYTRFLTAAGVLPAQSEIHTRWSIGLVDSPLLSTFACEKYVLADDPKPYLRVPFYTLVRQYQQDALLYNEANLPFGLHFTRYITEGELSQLTADDRAQALLRVAVLEDNAHELSHMRIDELQREIQEMPFSYVIGARRQSAFQMSNFRQSYFNGSLQSSTPGVLIMQMPYDDGWRVSVDGKHTTTFVADAGLLGVKLDAGTHHLEFTFRSKLFLPGLVVSCVALILVLLGLWRYPRLAKL